MHKIDIMVFLMVEIEMMIEKIQKMCNVDFDVEPLKKIQKQYERDFDRLNQESLKKS